MVFSEALGVCKKGSTRFDCSIGNVFHIGEQKKKGRDEIDVNIERVWN